MATPADITLVALTYINLEGIVYQAGDIFTAPEAQAMNLVGQGAAKQIPTDQGGLPGPPLATFLIPLTAEMGKTSIEVNFPQPSILLWAVSQVKRAFQGGTMDAQVSIGSAEDRNDILTADGMGWEHTISIRAVQNCLPFPEDPNPFEAWVNFDPMGAKEGEGLVLLIYAG